MIKSLRTLLLRFRAKQSFDGMTIESRGDGNISSSESTSESAERKIFICIRFEVGAGG